MVMLLCFRGGIAMRDFAVDGDGLVVFGAACPRADRAIRRAAALIRALPGTPLAAYREKTTSMPAVTEAEHLAKARIGQDVFRASLEDYWSGRRPITGTSSLGPTASPRKNCSTSTLASFWRRTCTRQNSVKTRDDSAPLRQGGYSLEDDSRDLPMLRLAGLEETCVATRLAKVRADSVPT
jgi:hypothetical protein